MVRANSFLGGKVYFRVVGELTRSGVKKHLEDKKDLNENGKVLIGELTQFGFKKPLEDEKNLNENGKVLELKRWRTQTRLTDRSFIT